MFREVRRKKNEIGIDAAMQLLKSERRGVLSVIGDDGYPYGVPINFFYDDIAEKIYFHGSRVGHKIDSIKRCSKVCFTVFGNVIVKEEAWAPHVQSAVVFGRCQIIDDQEVAISLVKKFASKYYPSAQLVEEEVSMAGQAVQMFEIEIEHISGKEVQEK